MPVTERILFSLDEANLVVQAARDDDAPVYVVGMMTALLKLGLNSVAARRLAREVFRNDHAETLQKNLNGGYELVILQLLQEEFWEVSELDPAEDVHVQLRLVDADVRHGAVGLDFAQHYLNQFVHVFRSFLMRIACRYAENSAVTGADLVKDLALIINENGDEFLYSPAAAATAQDFQVFLCKHGRYQNWLCQQKLA